jgi:CRISPR-associated protein Cas1
MLFFSQLSGMFKTDSRNSEDHLQENLPLESVDSSQSGFQSFDFQNRNRRPPKDPVNALLSLVYSLLSKDCTLICHAIGLDPYVGFLHQPRFGRPALALDLMEEFRPLVADSVVLSLINNRIISPKDFIRAGAGVNLTPEGRKRVFLSYERRMGEAVTHPVFQYRVGYRRAIELQGRLLAKYLTGEIESYYPFITR